MTQVIVKQPFLVAGVLQPVNSTPDIDASLANLMVQAGKAEYYTYKPTTGGIEPAGFVKDISGAYTGEMSPQAAQKWWRVLGHSAIPIIQPGSSSIGNNGALTLGTALNAMSFPQPCYAYFPANAIFAGSAAGSYFTILSSTTAGVIYNNLYAGGVPTIPASPVPFATTGPGAFTQTISLVNLLWLTIPGGVMGTQGGLRTSLTWSATNNANAKNARTYFGGLAGAGGTQVQGSGVTSLVGLGSVSYIRNRGSYTSQVAGNGTYGDTQGFGQMVYPTVNTAVDQLLAFTMQLATATDNAVLEGFTVESLFQ